MDILKSYAPLKTTITTRACIIGADNLAVYKNPPANNRGIFYILFFQS